MHKKTDNDCIAALDQGTTSTRCILFGREGLPVVSHSGGPAAHQQEHAQIYPHPGWVEHDANEIWFCAQNVIREAMEKAFSTSSARPAAIGITNQRETVVVWDRKTGEPVYNAIVWQCMRTQDFCAEWSKMKGWEQSAVGCGKAKDKTGLLVNNYFSGTKLRWILENVEGAKDKAHRGNLLFGTIDTWLLWNLTGGVKGGIHATDVTNASRTLLMNIKTLDWDEEMLDFLGIPVSMLPQIEPSSHVYGMTAKTAAFEGGIPVSGILGDQQAALFGQACFDPGMVKNTYGTGLFMLLNTGDVCASSQNGLLTTPAYSLEKGHCVYALEGSVAMGGATVQWLRDNLRMIDSAEDSEYFANKAKDSAGVYFVPAFSGLFAPYWDMSARGAIVGLTRYVRKEQLVYAALESICYQTRDVLEAMQKDSNVHVSEMKVDGGAVANDTLMQMQADIAGSGVVRPMFKETTALGAAYAAGLAVGFWDSLDTLRGLWKKDRTFSPAITPEEREAKYKNWRKAIEKSRGWLEEES
ncbi:MAG: glycerol kinase GlpK [Synergistaceae bacterium]|jgi:glycerol kinase|nr:glycerol kinase GlpK [Synergistaceae bacterium]